MLPVSHYTQIELTSPNKKVEVWWLPVPSGKAHAGEKITRRVPCLLFKDRYTLEEWTISQVCLTLLEEDLPPKVRMATSFEFESSTLTYMSI
jgi:hypothetical protein